MDKDNQRKKISKDEVVDFLRKNKGDFSEEEILEALQDKNEETEDGGGLKKSIKNKLMPGAAYAIGALIVIVGAILLGVDHWNSMGSALRISSVFGVGLFAYILVLRMEILSRSSSFLKHSLSVLAAILLFAGGRVVASEIFSLDFSTEVQVITANFITILFLVLFSFRKSSFYFSLIVLFSTWSLYTFISVDFFEPYIERMSEPGSIYAYLTALVGLLYLLVDEFLISRLELDKKVSSLMKFLGSLAIILSFCILGGIYKSAVWLMVAGLASLALTWAGFKQDKLEYSLSVFAVIPTYSFVMRNVSFDFLVGVTFVFSVLLLIYLIKKYDLLTYITASIFAGTAFIYATLGLDPVQDLIVANMENPETIWLLTTSLTAACYLYMGYLFSEKLNLVDRFSQLLYLLGSFGFVIPLFYVVEIYHNLGWDIAMTLIVLGVIALGTRLNRKTILIPGSLLLAIHIIIVSGRYFADNLGWPITLMVAGFAVMGIGYFSYRLVDRFEEN